EAFVGGFLLRRIPTFSITLERVTTVVALIVFAAMLSPVIAATVGVLSLYAGGIVQATQVRGSLRAWWVGDMVGLLLITPLILVWSTRPAAPRVVRWPETVALAAALAVVSALTFFSKSPHVPTVA